MREDAGSDALFKLAFYAGRTVLLDIVSPRSQAIDQDLDQRQEGDSYDDKSFCKQHKGPRTGPKEPAGANEFPADESRGFNFSPFIVLGPYD
ncbi:uncharacterized protein FRV6_16602 [Fusarium oxysporum]|uniref:Uncharacterized protein n=1 Tax=Fusarium oxysporum TaxID=5507 RepID=A0A2H3TV33_FUSOX|nr:uncharacterized protein FRV6_16602 [Fusarium oxysporum]